MKRKVKIIKKENEEKDSLLNEIKFKSQAAMEYLMTYGWAILIIALSLAVLYSLGIMNPKNFLPRSPPGSCFVFRPNGPGTTDFVSLQGTCGYLPMYVGSFKYGSWVKIGNRPELNFLQGNFTIVAWIQTTSQSSDNEIVAKGGSCSVGGYKLITYNGRLRGTFNNQSASPYYQVISDKVINDNSWHHVVFVVTGLKTSTTVGKLFIDGKLDKTGSIVDTTSWNTSVKDGLGIGYTEKIESNTCPNYFDGLIGNVQIYNTALTHQEIQYLYQQGLGGGPVRLQNLVAWWPLNGDAKDYSGNNLHGTIYNVAFVQNYNPP